MVGIGLVLLTILGVVGTAYNMTRAPGGDTGDEIFVVSQNASQEDIVANLKEKGLIRSPFIFKFFHDGETKAGGYTLSKSMNASTLAKTLTAGPTLLWVTIPEGLRKEQTARILADKLGWTSEQEKQWVTTDTNIDKETVEGVYFPDTYLIPLSETPAEIAARLRSKFNEKFEPLAAKADAENIKWTTLVKIASLIQREAAGKEDMATISGVIWNRLDKHMKLQIDATVQYAVETYANYDVDATDWEHTYHGEGKPVEDWWNPIKPEDLEIDALVNTYLHSGLPTRPIANPGLSALEAALSPEETDCLYYLHDDNRVIHCAATNEEHEENIEKYLRSVH